MNPGIPLRSRPALILGAIALLVVALLAGPPPAARAADCSGGYVGLTYDDGPSAGNTTNLLNALQQNGLRATMFNIGQNAQNNPSLVAAQKNAGMWIANHSWTHPHLTQLSQQQMMSELQQTQNVLQQQTGTAPRLFRPPYGETNATLRTVEQQLGLREILWDVDSQDWNGATTAQIVQRASSLQNGQIILMHDFAANSIAAIPQIAANLTSRNVCAGMISPTTGRAVAPDGGGTTDTTPPSAPSNLAASGTTASGTNLSWSGSTDNVGVTGYDILRAPGASGGTFAQVGTSTGTTFNNTGLSGSTAYRYQVRARDAAGNVSAVSNTVSVTTSPGGGGGTGGCTVTATLQSQWPTGYVIQLTVTNSGTATINSWTVTFALPAGHQLTGSWNGVVTTSGQNVTVKNVGFNGTIGPGASNNSFGFQAGRPNGNTALPSGYTCTTP